MDGRRTEEGEGLLADLVDKKQRLKRYLRWFDQSNRAQEEWRNDAIESRRFVNNDQWPDGDRERLGKTRRPFITINKILPRVLFLEGLQRSQRQEPKLLPFEGGDVRAAELMGALYKWAGTRTREAVIDSKVFGRKIVDGVGFWKVGWTFDNDVEGDLAWEAPDPLTIFPDPNWLDAGWDRAEYVIHATWMALEDAIDQWPEHRAELRRSYGEWLNESTSASGQGAQGGGEFVGDAWSSDRSYWDAGTQRARVLEVWYKKRQRTEVVMLGEGDEVISDPAMVDRFKLAVQVQPELEGQVKFLRMPVVKICVAHVMQDRILDDQPSPYAPTAFPIFPTVGYYWWKTPFGIVTPLKDLQREGNVRRSSIMELVKRATLSGFFNPQDTGANSTDLENYAAGIAKVINYRSERPTEITPPQLPQALVFLDSAADRDMDRVSNIHAELLGTTSQRTVSGKAIKARQQSGLIVQEPLLESFAQDKEPAVRFAVELMQQFYSVPKALRILGSIAVRAPQGPEAEMLQQQGFIEVRDLLKGAMKQAFDVVIGSKPFEPSLQQQKWSQLSELAQQFGAYVPPQVLIDALKDAGLLTEDQAAQTLEYVQQKLAMEQAAQGAAAAGAAPPMASAA